jgi:hypothetical protein
MKTDVRHRIPPQNSVTRIGGKKKKRRGRDIDAMADTVEVFKGRCTK